MREEENKKGVGNEGTGEALAHHMKTAAANEASDVEEKERERKREMEREREK